MSEPAKPLDENRDASEHLVSKVFVDDLDDILIEIREYVVNRALATKRPIRDRSEALNEIGSFLRQFASHVERETTSKSPPMIEGLAERVLRSADLHAVEAALSLAVGPNAKTLLDTHLKSLPFPHYEPVPGKPAWIVQVREDGLRTVGRFVDRQFVAIGGEQQNDV